MSVLASFFGLHMSAESSWNSSASSLFLRFFLIFLVVSSRVSSLEPSQVPSSLEYRRRRQIVIWGRLPTSAGIFVATFSFVLSFVS